MQANPINLTHILQINEINPRTLYQLAIKGIEDERINLQSSEQMHNAAGYRQALSNICEYQRILSVLRRDTLDAIAGSQSIN